MLPGIITLGGDRVVDDRINEMKPFAVCPDSGRSIHSYGMAHRHKHKDTHTH